jgi:hypothetical protein
MSLSADATDYIAAEYEAGKEYGTTRNKRAWPTFPLLKLLMNSTINKFHFHQKRCLLLYCRIPHCAKKEQEHEVY